MAKLTLIDGKLRIDWSGSDSGSLVLSDSEEDPCCCGNCEILKITYDWSESSSSDLDTGTTFIGYKVGWPPPPSSNACGTGNNEYISWGGDNTSSSASEYVLIYFKKALDAGLWNTSTQVDLAAGWYSPANGSGPAKVIVECYNVTDEDTKKEKVINPGSQNVCASTNVGSITIYEDGSFTLN
jgi:hypothetical protein